MQKNIQKNKITLPNILSKDWFLEKILSSDHTHTVCLLSDHSRQQSCILKILSSSDLSHKKLRLLFDLSDKHLILPQKHIHSSGNDYILYPKKERLEEVLYSGLTFQEFLSLGIDMISAAETLKKAKFYEADISPTNIYRDQNGFFCLGDLNIEKKQIMGTPPYFAPESTKENKSRFSLEKNRSKQFELEMIYSICQLLKSLCTLQNEFYFDEMRQILQKGIQEDPQKRYSSLSDLRNILEATKTKYPSHPYQLLVLQGQNHFLFCVRTLSTKKSPLSGFPVIIPVFFAFLILSFSLIRYVKTDQTVQNKDTLVLSKRSGRITDTDITKITFNPIYTDLASAPALKDVYTENPVITLPSPPTETELDIQNKDLSSFSTFSKELKDPSDIFCLYAGNNNFTDLKMISEFSGLRELYANDNKLHDISELSKCQEIEILVLSYNNITDISALTGLSKLYHLDLSSNRDLADISSLQKIYSLRILNISNTGISKKQYKNICHKLPDCQIIY